MNRPVLYLTYRRAGLRNAWALSGVGDALLTACKWAAIGVAMGAAVLAAQSALADARSATAAGYVAEVDQLRGIVAACLGDRDGALWVGDELHLCRAVPVGVKR